MIYIYEGVDGSGKSIKAQQDADTLGCKCIRNPISWTDKDAYEQWIKFFEDNKDKDLCVDRSFISNPIYRSWAHKEPEYTDEQLLSLLGKEFTLVYCESGTEYEDASARGEDNLKTKEDYDDIKVRYRNFIKLVARHRPVYIYNWRKGEYRYLNDN